MLPFAPMQAAIAILRHYWKPLLLIALILALFGFGWHVKAGIDKREAERVALEAKVAEQEIQLAVTRKMLADAKASQEAAQAARTRNDVEVPKARRESAARVERAASADAADSVQLGTEAVSAYQRAADRLMRGKSAP